MRSPMVCRSSWCINRVAFSCREFKGLSHFRLAKDTKDTSGRCHPASSQAARNLTACSETAMMPAAGKILGVLGKTGIKGLAKAGAELWASYGYTTVQEGRATPAVAEAIREAGAEGAFKVDVTIFPDVLADRDYIKKNLSKTYCKSCAHRGRQAVDGRVASGIYRLAGPPLLRASRHLSTWLRGLRGSTCGNTCRGHRLGLRERGSDHLARQRRSSD